jgi:dienelactone hydrolase
MPCGPLTALADHPSCFGYDLCMSCGCGLRLLIPFVALALAAWAPVRGQDLSLPGPHAAGESTVTVVRPGGSTFTAVLNYPATATGAGTPFDAAGAPYPGVAFGHGFFQPVSAYTSTLRHLATWGFFVISPTTQGGLFPSHAALADDLRHCLTWLQLQTADPASPYHQAVDTAAFGLSGHSMGGGASCLAAAADARVRALAPLAPAETNPSAVTALASVATPTRLVCGTQDSIVPTASNGAPMYAATAGPRQLVSIVGGWHCGFEDAPALGGFGCDSGALSRPEQLALTRRELTEFFLLYLAGDDARWSAVWGPQRLLDPAFIVERDARASFAPASASASGAAGQSLTIALAFTNTGAQPVSFALYTEGAQWPVALARARTPVLAPGQSIEVHLQATVARSPAAPTDRILVSARSELDGHTRAYAEIFLQRL